MMIKTALLALLLGSSTAHAFPEMVRHGYNRCNSCHFSPTGGGVLTPYGRALSAEVLSNTKFFFENVFHAKATESDSGASDESKFLHGTVHLPQWPATDRHDAPAGSTGGIHLGGDIRLIQTVRSTRAEFAGEFFLMQADLEALVEYSRIRVTGSLGRGENTDPLKKNFSRFFISRSHAVSLLLGPSDAKDQIQLRTGRFYPAYGLRLSEHTFFPRSKMGFDYEQESYNAEVSYFEPSGFVDIIATGIFGRPDQKTLDHERGGALQIALNPTPKLKIGANGLFGRNHESGLGSPDQTRRAVGVFGLVGFTEAFYGQIELDRAWTKGTTRKDMGNLMFTRLGYELTRGFHVQATQEYWDTPASLQEAYGIGFQYFPRPHWHFSLQGKAKRDSAQYRAFDQSSWFLIHYYL